VLFPIEPVDPRIAMRFMSGPNYGNARSDDRADEFDPWSV